MRILLTQVWNGCYLRRQKRFKCPDMPEGMQNQVDRGEGTEKCYKML